MQWCKIVKYFIVLPEDFEEFIGVFTAWMNKKKLDKSIDQTITMMADPQAMLASEKKR